MVEVNEQDSNEGQLKEFDEEALVSIGEGQDRCLDCTDAAPLVRGIRIRDPLKEDIKSHFGDPTGYSEEFP